MPKVSEAKLYMLIKRAEAGDGYAQAYIQHLEKYAFFRAGISQLGRLWITFRGKGLKGLGQKLKCQAGALGQRKVVMGRAKEIMAKNPGMKMPEAIRKARSALAPQVGPSAITAAKPSYTALARQYAPAMATVGVPAAGIGAAGYIGGRAARRD